MPLTRQSGAEAEAAAQAAAQAEAPAEAATPLAAPRLRALADARVTVVAGAVICVTVAWALGGVSTGYPVVLAAVLVGASPALLAAAAILRRRPRTSSPADRVTLGRAVLVSGCATAAVLVLAGAAPARTWWLWGLAAPAMLLDAVDGTVARRTGSAGPDGARLDMQVDAGFMLVLSFALAPVLGAWVLLVGGMRYLFVAASWVRPALRGTLTYHPFRRFAAGFQAVALVVAITPVVPLSVGRGVVLAALSLLAASFGRDVRTLERRGP